MRATTDLDQLLRDAVDDGITPGCVAMVWRGGSLRYAAGHGTLARPGLGLGVASDPVDLDAVYDLASLTKVLATTTLTALALGRGQLELDDRVPENLAVGDYRPRLRDLLEHASGLAAHREFFHEPWSLNVGQPEALIAAVREVAPEVAPRTRAIYSDLGFLLLGAWLEQRAGVGLADQFRDQIAAPLGLADAIFYGGATPLRRAKIAATEVYDPGLHDGVAQHWYGIRAQAGQAVNCGLVHDDNALVMGGVAGHAGLFGTAAGVLGIARAWLEHRLPGLDPQTSAALVERFTTPSTVPGSTRRLGFDGPSPDGSGSTGAALSARAFGHLGFTGTSVWIDPEPGPEAGPDPGAIYVLLTNRVHPTRAEPRIRELRPRFHELAATV